MILFVTLSVLGSLLYFSLNKIVYDGVDANLLSKAQALTVLTSKDKEDRAEFTSSGEFTWQYGSPEAKSFYQIKRHDGFTLEKSASLKDSELPYVGKVDRTAFRTIRVNGIPLRLVVFPVPVERETAANETQQGFVIQCARRHTEPDKHTSALWTGSIHRHPRSYGYIHVRRNRDLAKGTGPGQ